ncbi:MAG: ABC transporter permease [Verrucomicrobiota bacterium]
MKTLLGKLRAWFRRKHLEDEMAEEIRQHIEHRTQEKIADGLAPEEARYAALREFGGIAQVQEQCRDERRLVWLEQLAQDLRYAARQLRRNPLFATTAIATLALGIAAATVVFNLTSGLFHDLRYPNPAELVALGNQDARGGFEPDLSGLHLRMYQEQTTAFADYAAVEARTANLVVDGDPGTVHHVSISPDGFRMLGVQPALGRGFLPEEYRAGADDVVVITDYLWRTHFHADPAVLGREVLIDRRPCKIVGVLRPRQVFPFRFQWDVFRPLLIPTSPESVFGPGIHIVARLRAGVSPDQAGEMLRAVKFPASLPAWAVNLLANEKPVAMPLKKTEPPTRSWIMFAGGVFLFVIACLNVMNLMLVRLLGRGRELSVRLALGGTRWQLARLLLVESAGLALVAGGLVMLAAHLWFPSLFRLIYDTPRVQFDVFADAVTTVSVLSLSFLAVLGVALVPILQLRNLGVAYGLKTGGAPDIRRLGTVRNALVMLQSALAVLLLAGTGLMMRSFQKLHQVDLGFDPVGKVKVAIAFQRGFEPEEEARLPYFERLRDRVATLPGVRSASFGSDALLIGFFSGVSQLEMKDGTYRAMAESHVAANYAETAGLRLTRGRWVSDREGDREVVLNETAARARFGEGDPIGQMIRVKHTGRRTYQVVGVVGDVRETVRSPAGLRLYFPNWGAPGRADTLTLRLEREPGKELAGMLRRAIYEFDPALITAHITTIRGAVDGSMGACCCPPCPAG